MTDSFSLTYGSLSPDMQQRWRALGIFPGTFDEQAAAALWDTGTGAGVIPSSADRNVIRSDAKDPGMAAPDTLSGLVKQSMLEWDETAERYRLDDSMRDFARVCLEEAGEADEAARRHATYFSKVLARANDLYAEGGDSSRLGLAWFDLEWGNIQAGQAWAAAQSEHDEEAARLCSRYANVGIHCLASRLDLGERIRWIEAALAAARGLRDPSAEAVHLANLGNACRSLGEYSRAIECYEQALPLLRESGNRRGEGYAFGRVADSYARRGEYRRAIEYHEKALAVHRENGDRRSEGGELGEIGNACFSLGEYRRAIEYHEQNLAIARETGDRWGEGNALNGLGIACDELGDHRRAIECHQQSLAIKSEIGDREGEGIALGNLAVSYDNLGEYRRAIEYHERALAIDRETGDLMSEGARLWNMSLTLHKLGERAQAMENARTAFEILEQIEDPNAARLKKQLEEWRVVG